MGDEQGPGVWIESTRGPDHEPVCLITFGPIQGYPPVADVRATALDLVTCAAYAEMMLELAEVVKLPGPVVAKFITSLLSGQGRRMFGAKTTLTLLPALTTPPRKAVVVLKRGSQQAALTTAEARDMALAWLAVAEATESDQLVSSALDAAGMPEDTQAMLFGYLHAIRSDTPDAPAS